MYDDPSFIRDVKIRINVNEYEQREIEDAARNSGRERATFIRDAALVISRCIAAVGNSKPRGDILQQMQMRLAMRPAANDDHPMYSLAS